MKEKMKSKINVVLFFLVLFLFSCAKEEEFKAPTAYTNSPEGNFEAFWNGIDQNYAFFKYDPVNWDSMYNVYRPKVNSKTTKKELFDIFEAMMTPLIDGHRELITNDTSLGGFSLFNQSYVDKYPFTFSFDNLLQKLDTSNGLFSLSGSIGGDTPRNQYIISKIKNKPILYIKMEFFGNGLQNSTNYQAFSSLINQLNNSNYTSVIIDLRSNGGGLATEFYTFMSFFISSDYTWGYSQVRLARDRFTMSPKIPQVITPAPNNFKKRVVLLVDRYSFSAAELTALAMKGLPNITVMGQPTGGATGPVSTEKDFTGNFSLKNGWTVQLAQRVTFDKDQKLFEWVGVTPDIEIPFDIANFQKGTDDILEAAINHLE